LKKPITVTSVASSGTARALHRCVPGQSTRVPASPWMPHVSARPASRASVRTNIDENHPMQISPIQRQVFGSGGRSLRRPMKGSGMVAAERTSAASNSSAPAGVRAKSAGTRRRAM
jgi:hypothetical protein